MRENSDELDLHSCLRRARRWAIALLCLLAINGSLVALAYGGFGAAFRREPTPRGISAAPPVVPTVATTTAVHPAPAPQPRPAEPDVAPLPVTVADPPPVTPVVDVPSNDPPPAVTPPDKAAGQPADSLIVANPPDIGGAVHFTVNGVIYTLAPGEYVELAGRSDRRIEFHRGDDFGYATHELAGGTYTFELCPTGWSLQLLDPVEARELLCVCRAKTDSP